MALMAATSVFAHVWRPTLLMASQREKVNLETLVPKQFGNWRELEKTTGQIINPQTSPILQKLYTQTLSRSYANSKGKVIMLSIAYGANQSDGVALHYPEVCYPAQGFQVISDAPAVLDTQFGTIEGKQLMTRLGNRSEPVTYWTTLGDKVVQGGIRTKLAQLEYGFHGLIPDGLIFRVSSIDSNPRKGYADQEQFAQELLATMSSSSRLRLAGLAR
jgi:EpsI family protein